jgi:uncharacterized membrane protein (Fun14 family)
MRAGLATLSFATAGSAFAYCDTKQTQKPVDQSTVQDESSPFSTSSNEMLNMVVSTGSTLTFGGIMGFCSGVMMKKVGKVVIVLTGGVFAMFQAAANAGYIDVKWDKVKHDFEGVLDLNGDNKLDASDVKLGLNKVTTVLTNNMATTAGGFTAGFLLGLRKG